MKRETLLRHLRAMVSFYKKRHSAEEVARTLSYKPLYVRKVLQSKPIRPHVIQLTHGFIEKARGYFDQMIAVLP
jgi:hypothetical protein